MSGQASQKENSNIKGLKEAPGEIDGTLECYAKMTERAEIVSHKMKAILQYCNRKLL